MQETRHDSIFDGYVEVGGVSQYLNIRGENETAPVLLLVHGGPGFSDMAFTQHGFNHLLEKHFLVVTWDQRGTARSYSDTIPLDSMTVEQIVRDGREVAQWLCRRFSRDRIFMRGHSWGGYLGMKIIERYPQCFYAYFALSPFVDFSLSEPISYQFVAAQAQKKGRQEAIKELEEIGPPPYADPGRALQVQRKWLDLYGGMVFGGGDSSARLFSLFSDIPGYSEHDYQKAGRGQEMTMSTLFEAGLTRSLFKEVKGVNVPVFMGVGRSDYLNCSAVTESYFRKLRAPQKELIWFERSAHFPQFSEAEKFQRVMKDKFLTLLR